MGRVNLDALPYRVVILDKEGIIKAANDRWMEFGLERGLSVEDCGKGVDYLTVTKKAVEKGEDKALKSYEAYKGIKAVLEREKEEFELEYPCPTPQEEYWFKLKARYCDQGALIVHEEITERKMLEKELKITQFSVDNSAIGVVQITPG